MNIKQQSLIEKGFYVGKVEELVTDLDEFNQMCDFVMNFSYTDDNWDCYYPVKPAPETPAEIKKMYYDNPECWPSVIKMHEVEERKILQDKYKLSYDQKWYRLLNDPQPVAGVKFKYFQKLSERFIAEAYPEMDLNSAHHNNVFALYDDKDCYIDRHKDGQTGKFCGIIIYLSPEDTWKDGGGEFLCGTDTNNNPVSDKVIPVRGNYVVLDFMRHDAWHEVLPVKNGFKRWSYLDFVREEKN